MECLRRLAKAWFLMAVLSLSLLVGGPSVVSAHYDCEGNPGDDAYGYWHCHTGYDHEHGHYETKETWHYHPGFNHWHYETVWMSRWECNMYGGYYSGDPYYGWCSISYAHWHDGYNHLHSEQVWVVDEIHHHEPSWHYHEYNNCEPYLYSEEDETRVDRIAPCIEEPY